MRKVLIANRGEIAVRIARACRDASLASVAVYADPDRDALHVRVADEAFALGGKTPGESYLRIDKVLQALKRSGADAVHPGYGFLSENAEFAEAVLDAGATWIGPSPAAIAALGDKTTARRIARKIGAPLTPGTADPVQGVDEVLEFVAEHGLPVAIKAAFGGGGRGLKIARKADEIEELYESAVREAVAAFGRGECFVERYLDRPRHVETQVLADTHGNVVVVGTRDCSLQRRYQKVVEEAPAPFLSAEQRAQLYDASKKIMREAGYIGAGTCEFLVAQDGLISFLEVNTRLQVEHPVTEQVTGIDLVREQFRIAEGRELTFADPEPRGHSFEFRINGEDPGRGFLPAPGAVTTFVPPLGPGVRVDTGIESGSVVGGAFDSLLAKLIVTGATRTEALERSRRALDEMRVEGMATLIPFHRKVVRDEAFAPRSASEPFTVHNRWIETEFENDLPPYASDAADLQQDELRDIVVVEVGGRRLEVSLPAGLGGSSGGESNVNAAPKRSAKKAGGAAASGDSLTSPMQGTIVKVAVEDGATVAAGELIVVLEAMKMEQPINAHKAGTVSGLSAAVGEVVSSGAKLCDIND